MGIDSAAFALQEGFFVLLGLMIIIWKNKCVALYREKISASHHIAKKLFSLYGATHLFGQMIIIRQRSTRCTQISNIK